MARTYSVHNLAKLECCKYFLVVSLPRLTVVPMRGRTGIVLSLSPALLAEALAHCRYAIIDEWMAVLGLDGWMDGWMK